MQDAHTPYEPTYDSNTRIPTIEGITVCHSSFHTRWEEAYQRPLPSQLLDKLDDLSCSSSTKTP